ncbi:UDP-2,4-diacetamido-2,4,6-trideoxy-beta-L-altropyranose hydrolase [Pseudodesulfovibrio sp. zrk46]|uniref:UDP-2,4-diacetamido-2,4, 6-trideoxy-beta-L-altropyranose hydrolase n=1 Tax=Pseudodesulfovibrio sp. zrk46 TaxID=2725288 RepID=UPI001FFC5C02|nr:UDP-2,4-diacetamido-2,4,6-trideoxy-beta-L-altropyranose hydrolase [Pseudodesulfovibrio sp. zrk46]
MRMIALGQAWKQLGGKVRIVGQITPLIDRLSNEHFELVNLDNTYPSPEDIEVLLEATSKNEWIAIDGYQFDSDYQKQILEAGRRTLVLDDVNDRGRYYASALLNQNPDGNHYDYKVNEDAIRLLGSRFALLRHEFLSHPRKDSTTSSKPRNILVTLGGGDPTNMTGTVIESITQIDSDDLHVKVVCGAANPHLDKLKTTASNLKCHCEFLTAVNDMPSLINWADIAISAAGSTCWELCYFRVPTVAIQIADNQKGIIRELNRIQAAICLSMDTKANDITKALSSLLTNTDKRKLIEKACSTIVDGKGAHRVACALLNADIRLRPATVDDSRRLYNWRNHPAVRARSFQSDPIEYGSHEAWFKSKLADASCKIFIAESTNGTALGQIRFEGMPTEALISISVAPDHNGRGIGTHITKLGCQSIEAIYPGIPVTAFVMKDNPASANMFRAAGFISAPNDADDSLKFEWKHS